jgi:3,4-dihydroxy 2-butanone 4-phosphate synthase
LSGALDEAVEALRRGRPVLIFDDERRESEVDMVFHASFATPEVVYTLRTVAGGLICFATEGRVASELGIPWGDELIARVEQLRPLALRLPRYGDRTAFTIWVNHVSVRTGISDEDRSRTLLELDRVVSLLVGGHREEAVSKFRSEFQAPGHVPILATRGPGRRGHTELSIALARIAGLTPSIVLAEMLDRGGSLPLDKAARIAEEKGWPLVKGSHILGG